MGIRALGQPQFARVMPPADLRAEVLEGLDRLRVAITLFDSDERLVYSNAHYQYVFRSLPPATTLIGATYETLIRLELDGGEIAAVQAASPEDFVAMRRRQLLEDDFRPLDVHLADGRIIEVKSRRTADGWIVLWNDATYTRRLLARLEDTIELSVDAFAFWDERDRLTLCNSAFALLHGLDSPETAEGASFAELTEIAMRRGKFTIDGASAPWFERRLDTHRAAVGALTIATPGGDAYLVRERATRGGGSVTVLTDVSERHRAEAALAEQARALARAKRALQKTKSEARRKETYLADLTRRLDAAETEADTAKTTLLRTMSHELKTPLNAIIGFADILRTAPERLNTAQIGEYAGLIHAAGGNLLRLINQILDLTKIASGRYPLQREPVAVAAVAARALELNAALIETKAHRVDDRTFAAVATADADESALTTMLGQLVENAATYTQSGGAIALHAEKGDGIVRIVVTDNGPGVAAGDLDRILQPFEQGGRGTTDHSAGTGLGLTIVKALAELHGGRLVLASAPGDGFTATLELPAA